MQCHHCTPAGFSNKYLDKQYHTLLRLNFCFTSHSDYPFTPVQMTPDRRASISHAPHANSRPFSSPGVSNRIKNIVEFHKHITLCPKNNLIDCIFSIQFTTYTLLIILNLAMA